MAVFYRPRATFCVILKPIGDNFFSRWKNDKGFLQNVFPKFGLKINMFANVSFFFSTFLKINIFLQNMGEIVKLKTCPRRI